MWKASEAMEQPTCEMAMQRQNLYEQYGLIPFGSIMTFRLLQLIVVKDSALPVYRWGRAKYFVTHHYKMLDRYVEEFMRFGSEHNRPGLHCPMDDIEKYVSFLMCFFCGFCT